MNTIVNPTRLERQNQRMRERVAKRGHKLLKDKQTEMFRNLLILEKESQALRLRVEKEITEVFRHFTIASSHMSPVEIKNAIKSAKVNFEIEKKSLNIMGLIIPQLEFKKIQGIEKPSFVTTHPSFDQSVYLVQNLAPRLIELGCKEKACDMLRAEIATLRRRINALEHIVIPRIQGNIKYITFKLAENERGNLVRLMKVKEMHQANES